MCRSILRSVVFCLFVALAFGASLFSRSAEAVNLPPGFVLTKLPDRMQPVSRMTVAPDGRLFVCEIQGRLWVFKNDVLVPKPFLTVDAENTGEHGLDGVFFDPNFETNHYIYVYYTAKTPTVHCRLSRFTANGDEAVPGSELVLLELDTLTSVYHVAGGLGFGPDGKIYIGVGDDGHGYNAQDLTTLKGKLLRINPDGTIPTDNPFYSSTTGKNRAIWALGLRNPFSFTFEKSTGRLLINDVGEEAWEEINEGRIGANYGWPVTEGPTTDDRYQTPLFYYHHGDGNDMGCAITDGVFYNPKVPQFPSTYLGKYFFLDFCNKWIKFLDPQTNAVTTFATDLPVQNNCSIAISPDGSLYYAETWDAGALGAVYKITYTAELTPQIGTQPTDQLVSVNDTATFEISAYGGSTLTYQWTKNGAPIPGANSSSYTTPPTTLADDGATFACVVKDTKGATATSDTATLRVTNDKPPVPSITLPVTGTHYRAGDTIQFAGTATDAEDSNIAQTPSAFNWNVVFHHHAHTHPFLENLSGITSGSFTIPRKGETSTDVWYRIELAVTDSGGLTSDTFVDVLPSLSQITLATNPRGLPLTLDGKPISPPPTNDVATFESVVNFIRTLGADTFQTFNGQTYEFVAWSDGGAAIHDISTSSTPTTYTATYRAVPSSGSETINANPNPIVVTDGSGLGVTTIFWKSTGTSLVEVHLDSPDGPLFARTGSGSHSLTTGKWVRDGKKFFLQNVSGGLPLTAANTLGQVTVLIEKGSAISADPNPIIINDGTGQGVTTVSWDTPSAVVQVHVDAPNGPLMAQTVSGHHSLTTGKWVSNGTTFYLQEASHGEPLDQAHTLAKTTVVVATSTPAPTPTPTPTPTATPISTPVTRPLNMSTRLTVRTGENVLIGGIYITGNAPKEVMVRGIGPSITANGSPLPGRLSDPILELHDSTGATIATNDNWKIDDQTHQSQQAKIQATTIAPSHDLESALIRTLAPGPYTVVLRGKAGSTGIGLVEAYDLDESGNSEFANTSTRGLIETGDNLMIGGFILGGGNSGSTVLIRGLGPSLASHGVSNVLPDPTVELRNTDGVLVVSNDNWKVDDQTQESQEASVNATTIPPSSNLESAILARLAPGTYTAVLKGQGGGTGVGLLEIYHLP